MDVDLMVREVVFFRSIDGSKDLSTRAGQGFDLQGQGLTLSEE